MLFVFRHTKGCSLQNFHILYLLSISPYSHICLLHNLFIMSHKMYYYLFYLLLFIHPFHWLWHIYVSHTWGLSSFFLSLVWFHHQEFEKLDFFIHKSFLISYTGAPHVWYIKENGVPLTNDHLGVFGETPHSPFPPLFKHILVICSLATSKHHRMRNMSALFS